MEDDSSCGSGHLAPYTGFLEQGQHIVPEEGKLLYVVHERQRRPIETRPMKVQNSLPSQYQSVMECQSRPYLGRWRL